MKIILTEVYTFDKLGEEAKDKARTWYTECSYSDSQFAWDTTVDDAKEVGLVITSLTSRRANEGSFATGAFDCAQKICADHGETCETHKTAKQFLISLEALNGRFPNDPGAEYAIESEELEKEFLRSVLEDYRTMLERDLEYQSGNEYVDENIRINEYTFTKEGKRFG